MTLRFTLPAALDAPVITSPASGSVITGERVTVTGTGIAGVTVQVWIEPADVDADQFAQLGYEVRNPSTVVAADGTWSVSTALPFSEYTALAFHSTSPAMALSDPLSTTSDRVSFSVAAPVSPAPGASGQLAATGADGNALAGVGAMLMVLGGAALVVLRRKRGLVG